MKCPVCGMTADERKAAKSIQKGIQYAFCGPDCKQAFDKEPDRYTGAREPAKMAP